MKRFITSTLFLLVLLSSAYAERVSYELASKYATSVFATAQNTLPNQIRISNVKPALTKSTRNSAGFNADAEPNYYIFNNESGKGFVIISADDAARPVLAYSEEGSFKEGPLPENIEAWLIQLDDQFDYIRKNNIKASNEGIEEWNDIVRGAPANPTGQVTLTTADWDQGNPYNLVIPEGCVTGCVQTAIAIMMKYYEYPDGPKKTYTKTIEVNGKNMTVTVEAQANKYNWDTMEEGYEENAVYTREKNPDAYNVSQLMYDLGVMQEAEYTTRSTGAFSSSISSNLTEYFGYSKNAKCKERDYYSKDEWSNMLRAEIDKKHPIVYSGSSKSGGHCFICDGYADNYYFQINWGWGGYCNGWFLLDVFQPSGQGTGGNDGSAYSQYQDAQFDLVPDPDGTSVLEKEYIMSLDGIECTSNKEVNVGDKITLTALGWYNMSAYTIECEYGVYESSNQKTHRKAQVSLDHYYGYSTLDISATNLSRVRLGDYVTLYFKPTGESVHFPAYDSDKIRGNIPLIDAAYIICDESSLTNGSTFKKKLFYGREIPASVVWSYDGNIKNSDIILSSGKHTIKATITYSDKRTETVVKEINVK